MKYGLALRQFVLAYKKEHGLTYAQTSAHFGIKIRNLFTWAKKLEPCTTRNKPPSKISDEILLKDIETYPDDYQWERAKRLNVSQSGICYALRRLNMSRKKNTSTPQSQRRKTKNICRKN